MCTFSAWHIFFEHSDIIVKTNFTKRFLALLFHKEKKHYLNDLRKEGGKCFVRKLLIIIQNNWIENFFSWHLHTWRVHSQVRRNTIAYFCGWQTKLHTKWIEFNQYDIMEFKQISIYLKEFCYSKKSFDLHTAQQNFGSGSDILK